MSYSLLQRSAFKDSGLHDLVRNAIGVDLYNSPTNYGNYPPHNIVAEDDNTFVLTLAVAGFTKEEITTNLHKGMLVIEGRKEFSTNANYLHQGIAFRPFKREFRLGQHVRVESAELDKGLLNIRLVREIPEEDKPIPIEITAL